MTKNDRSRIAGALAEWRMDDDPCAAEQVQFFESVLAGDASSLELVAEILGKS